MSRSNRRVVFAITVVALLMSAEAALSCPSCYGAPDSPMTEGMNVAILSLLGITGGVLAGFVAFFMYLRKRATMIQRSFSDMIH